MRAQYNHQIPEFDQGGLPSRPSFEMPHILIIDDSRDIGWTTAKLLSMAGYKTSFATNIEDAAAVLKSSDVSLVIIDGDLGDNDYSAQGRAGRFIEDHLSGRIRFVRCSGRPEEIPSQLHGEKCFTKNGHISEIEQWLLLNLPPS